MKEIFRKGDLIRVFLPQQRCHGVPAFEYSETTKQSFAAGDRIYWNITLKEGTLGLMLGTLFNLNCYIPGELYYKILFDDKVLAVKEKYIVVVKQSATTTK